MQCTSGTAELWGWLGYNPTNNLAFSLISQAPNLKMFLGIMAPDSCRETRALIGRSLSSWYVRVWASPTNSK